ncbi:MAG: AmmeMemoRadiSam system protein A [Pseudomonadales bacterium]|nr:AmmeMemoRadiSam system protein A [Pseudomonadales bacterium]
MSELNQTAKNQLLEIAEASVQSGVSSGRPIHIVLSEYDAKLSSERASFVTLHLAGQLRGCIGSLQAYRPLAQDVADNAFAAAFRDPRFPPVSAGEAAQLHFHISVLSETSPMSFKDEQDLLSQIRPEIDGLVLEDGFNRGTFLPSVWEQLPDKRDFLNQLKRKAGLPPDYWSNKLAISRYTVEDIEANT